KMCQTIGIEKIADLFRVIPSQFRLDSLLDLPRSLSEPELLAHLQQLADQNLPLTQATSFLGAGAYHHYIPAAVDAIIRRGEFATSYTPYQPELSQGTLQAIFEFQTMMASLFGMEVSN